MKMLSRALLLHSRIDEEILNSERTVQARMIPQILAGGAVLGNRNEALLPLPVSERTPPFVENGQP